MSFVTHNMQQNQISWNLLHAAGKKILALKLIWRKTFLSPHFATHYLLFTANGVEEKIALTTLAFFQTLSHMVSLNTSSKYILPKNKILKTKPNDKIIICHALRNLVPCTQNLKREKHHGGVLILVKPAILLKVTLLHGCFSRFLNCTNDIKSRNATHMYNKSYGITTILFNKFYKLNQSKPLTLS